MFNGVKKGLKEAKKCVDKKVQMCKDMLASRSNRAVIGVIITSLGIGLIITGYMPLPV